MSTVPQVLATVSGFALASFFIWHNKIYNKYNRSYDALMALHKSNDKRILQKHDLFEPLIITISETTLKNASCIINTLIYSSDYSDQVECVVINNYKLVIGEYLSAIKEHKKTRKLILPIIVSLIAAIISIACILLERWVFYDMKISVIVSIFVLLLSVTALILFTKGIIATYRSFKNIKGYSMSETILSNVPPSKHSHRW
jgi:hypothetical protein